MFPSTLRWLAPVSAISVLLLFLLLQPLRAAADVTPGARASIQPAEVRDALGAAGYSVDYAVDWPDHAVMLGARAGDRTVRAFIYRDEESAAVARTIASAQDPHNANLRYSDNAGPQLLSGFGASAWRRNVAVVESSPEIFSELMPPDIDCADSTVPTLPDLSRTAYRVDPTILRMLEALP